MQTHFAFSNLVFTIIFSKRCKKGTLKECTILGFLYNFVFVNYTLFKVNAKINVN